MHCGGCHYQHITYETQLSLKRAILEDQLRRIGKLEPPGEIEIVSGEPWNYRNRVQLHIHDGEIGYLQAQSHRLCPIANCPIASPAINRCMGFCARCSMTPSRPRFIRSLELFTNETQIQLNVLETERPVARRFFEWCAERLPGWTSGAVDYAAGEFVWRVSGGSFFRPIGS